MLTAKCISFEWMSIVEKHKLTRSSLRMQNLDLDLWPCQGKGQECFSRQLGVLITEHLGRQASFIVWYVGTRYKVGGLKTYLCPFIQFWNWSVTLSISQGHFRYNRKMFFICCCMVVLGMNEALWLNSIRIMDTCFRN